MKSYRCIIVPTAVLALIILIAIFAPILAPADPLRTDSDSVYAPPSAAHPLGTDQLGRDVYARLLWGGRRTLLNAAFAVLVSVIPGAMVGAAAGYRGGGLDSALMALMDALLAFPSLLLAMFIVAILERGGWQIALAVGFAGIPAYARVARAAVMEARELLFVEAARSIGARPARIIALHIVPNIAGTLLSFGAVTLSWAILNGAALSFLGLGGELAAPDWGVMLAEGRYAFRLAPWVAAAPGIAITLTVWAINSLADGLQRVLARECG